MATVTIIGSGMMGSALAFPARENGNEVRLVGTHLDREIIDACRATNRHPKFAKHFPKGVPGIGPHPSHAREIAEPSSQSPSGEADSFYRTGGYP